MLMCLPRMRRMAVSGIRSKSSPPNLTEPETISPTSGSNRIIESAAIDLPHPDSPSNAKVSPLRICNVSPSTARTGVAPV